MSQYAKDLVLVSLINLAMTLYHLGTILFPFYLSLLHLRNPQVSSKDLFAALFFMYIGQSLGSNMVPVLIRVIGYRLMIILGMVFFLLYIKVWIYQFSLPMIYLSNLLMGLWNQIWYDSNNLFFSQKYEAGILRVKYVHMARLFLSTVLIYVFQIQINPSNDLPEQSGENRGFYGPDIVEKFQASIDCFGYISCILIALSSIAIQEPRSLRQNIGKFLKSIR